MKKILITLALILIASNGWPEVLSLNLTEIAKLKPLMGTWDFTHERIINYPSDTRLVTYTFTLNNIYKHDGKYYIGGPDATAHYHDVEGHYHMWGLYELYVFNFTGANTLAGTYYPGGVLIEVSVPFTGIKVAKVSPDPCPIIQIYDEHSEQTALLRSIRDNVLSQTHEGRELIKLYYQWSPIIVRIMKRDEEFKQEVKDIVDEILPLISQ